MLTALGSYVYDTCSQTSRGKESGKQSLCGQSAVPVRSVPTQRQNVHATVLIMPISKPMYSFDFCISQMLCSPKPWPSISVNRITNTTVKPFVKSIELSTESKYLCDRVVEILSNLRKDWSLYPPDGMKAGA